MRAGWGWSFLMRYSWTNTAHPRRKAFQEPDETRDSFQFNVLSTLESRSVKIVFQSGELDQASWVPLLQDFSKPSCMM